MNYELRNIFVPLQPMRRLPTLIILLLVLAACTTRGRYDAMRAGLDSINQLNRTDQPFAAADVIPYAHYFDRHGTANDRLLAHYLLGRAYPEHGEAPMALQYYQEAADCADTTATDCDYAQLCRVYSQMGVLFYQQALYDRQIKAIKKAVVYSLLAHDTIVSMLNYEQFGGAYEKKGYLDSALKVFDSVANWYQQRGYQQDAAIVRGRASAILVDMHELKKAKSFMFDYENHSGLFDNYGNIKAGREVYYNVKGLLNFYEEKFDSAEYWFRKELREGHDFNNQNMGSKGLVKLYEKKHLNDSVSKYALYAYAMNDSMYTTKTTETVERLKTMYDYSRHQELARKESERAAQASRRFWIILSVLLIVCMVACWLYIGRKEIIGKLEEMTADLAEARAEHEELLHDKSANQQTIAENSRRIKQLEKNLGRYGKLVYFGQGKAEADLKISPNYQAMKEMARRGKKLSEEEWAMAEALVNEYFPGCYDLIASKLHSSPLKFRICLLLRLHFINKEVSGMIGYTPAYSSKLSAEIHKDLYGGTGGSKELATNLSKLF